MAGGFSIGVAADTRAFESGVKSGIIDPVEDAQDKLEQLGRSGDKAGDGLAKGSREAELSLGKLGKAGKSAGDDVERGSRDADRALDQLGRTGKDAGDDVERGARDADRALDKLGKAGKEAGNDLESGLKDAQKQTRLTTEDYKAMTAKIEAETRKLKQQGRDTFDGPSESVREFKDEAKSNLSEVTSSFTGDMTSIQDLVQGTFGGLASLGGPIGLAFAGAAVGVGIFASKIQDAAEQEEELKERTDALTSEFIDQFATTYDSGDKLAAGLADWARDADKYGVALGDSALAAKKAGVDFGAYARAIATQNVPALKDEQKALKARARELEAQSRTADNPAQRTQYLLEASAINDQLLPAVRESLSAHTAAEQAYKSMADAQGISVEQFKAEQAAIDAANKATEDFASTMSTTLAEAAESSSEALDNAAGDPQKYLDGLNERTAAAQQYQANVQAIGEQLPGDLFNFVREQGPGFSQEIATYLAASPEQQAAIRDGWKIDAQVTADTTELDQKTADKGKEKKPGPTSEVKGDTKDLDQKVTEKGKEKADGPTSKLRADDSAVTKAMEQLRNKSFNGPTALFQVDRSSVNNAIANIRNTVVTIKVKAVDG